PAAIYPLSLHDALPIFSDISTLEQARKEYEVLNAQLEELRKALPLAAQSGAALAHWPREVTRERVETLEAELRRALAQPAGLLQDRKSTRLNSSHDQIS